MKVSCLFISWNARGLTNQKTVEMLFNLLKQHKLILVFITEPIVLYTNALDALFQTDDLHFVANSHIINKVAKLLYFAVPHLVQNFLVNSQFIFVNCLFHDKCFCFSMVYGANTYSVRRHLWGDLSLFFVLGAFWEILILFSRLMITKVGFLLIRFLVMNFLIGL